MRPYVLVVLFCSVRLVRAFVCVMLCLVELTPSFAKFYLSSRGQTEARAESSRNPTCRPLRN